MTWRRPPDGRRSIGQCLTPGCKRKGWNQPWYGETRARSYCQAHARAYDKAATELGGAVVYRMADYERDPETGFLRRRTG